MEKKDMKGGREEEMTPEKREVRRFVFVDKCPYCNEEVLSNSESALKYNLGIHIDKHIRNGDSLPSVKQ